MRTATSLALAIAVGSSVFAASERSAQAQEIVLTGPLKGAPPVIKLRLYRENRFEIAPLVGFTLLDEYQHSYLFGLRATYYPTDWLGIGIWGGVAVNADTDLTSQINNIAPRDAPETTGNVAPCVPQGAVATGRQSATMGVSCPAGQTSPNFSDQTAKMSFAVIPQITAVPFRGKLALFQALFVDTEAYLFAGLGVVGFQERPNCGDTTVAGQVSCSQANTFQTGSFGSSLKFTVSAGLGLTFFLNELVNIGVEYRALIYPADGVNAGGFDSRGLGPNQNFPDGKINGSDATSHLNHIIGLSVGFMLGHRKVSVVPSTAAAAPPPQ
jgi:outer membrane beta-barrel protein